MKGTILILILPLVLLIHFYSCQKEINPLEPARTTNNDSTLLSLFVELDTLHTPGLDTSRKIKFQYDNQKRVSNIEYYIYDTMRGSLNIYVKYQMTYGVNDSLPVSVKGDWKSYYPGSNQYGEFFANIFYELNGKLQNTILVQRAYADSILFNSDSTVVHYTYPGAIMQRIGTLYFNGALSGIYDSTVLAPQFVNGNMVSGSVVRYSINLNNITSYKYEYTNSFDNKPNPLKILRFILFIMPELGPQDGYFCGSGNGGDGFLISPNNVTSYSERFIYNSGYEYTSQFTATYTYNSAGLPVQSIFNRTEYGFRYLAGKKLYFYTK